MSMDARITVPEWVLINAMRYAMGRMTYVTSDTADLVLALWPTLSDDARNILRQDMETEFARADRLSAQPGLGHPLGMACDIRSWERVRALWRSNGDDGKEQL